MNRHLLSFIAWVLVTSLGFSAKAVESQSEFSGFQLSTCTVTRARCLTLSAETGLGSNVKALYVLKNPSIQIFNPEKGLEPKISATSGYIDFELQRAVLSEEIKPGVFKETIIDLKSLKLSSTVMK